MPSDWFVGGLDVQGAVALTAIGADGKVVGTRQLDTPLWSLVGANERVFGTSGGTLIVFDADLNKRARINVGTFLSQPAVVP